MQNKCKRYFKAQLFRKTESRPVIHACAQIISPEQLPKITLLSTFILPIKSNNEKRNITRYIKHVLNCSQVDAGELS